MNFVEGYDIVSTSTCLPILLDALALDLWMGLYIQVCYDAMLIRYCFDWW